MRSDPEPDGSERILLAEYLDSQREIVLTKTEGLVQAQLVQRHPPSELTLAGLLFHLSLVEETWMEERFSGRAPRAPWEGVDWEADPDWEFRNAESVAAEELRDRYRQACERSRRVAAAASGLSQLSVATLRDGRHFSLRWVLLHLIEETARHAGHADMLREAIDGTVGE
jgi:uncharacterized damage-inducible protein DinB